MLIMRASGTKCRSSDRAQESVKSDDLDCRDITWRPWLGTCGGIHDSQLCAPYFSSFFLLLLESCRQSTAASRDPQTCKIAAASTLRDRAGHGKKNQKQNNLRMAADVACSLVMRMLIVLGLMKRVVAIWVGRVEKEIEEVQV